MPAQQSASFVAGRLRLLWHKLFNWKDYASSATSKLCCWKTSSSLTQLSSGRLLAGPAPSKPYFRETSSPLIPLLMLETLSPLNITSFGNTSLIKSSLLYTRKENALLFRVSQTCSKNFLAMLSHVIHCHFYFLVLPQSEIYYFSGEILTRLAHKLW